MERPKLLIIAGPNGAGKTSSLTLETQDKTNIILKNGTKVAFINTDIIAAKLFPQNKGEYGYSEQRKAGASALTLQKQFIQKRQSFAVESTLSGKQINSLITQAKAAGYEISLFYVAVNSKAIQAERIRNRVIEGGHNVLLEDAQRRYDRSIKNLNNLIAFVDKVVIYDNSGHKKRHLASIQNNKVSKLNNNPPPWFKATHKELKLKLDKQSLLNEDLFIYDVPYKERYEAHKAGLVFNSYIKKYTSIGAIPPNQYDWHIHKHLDNPGLDNMINQLKTVLKNKDYYVPETLLIGKREKILRQQRYKQIISESSLKDFHQRTEREYDAILLTVPSKNNLQAILIDNDNNISHWDYKASQKKVNEQRINHEKAIQEDQQELYNDTAEKAQIIYEKTSTVQPFFGYLKKKQIRAYPNINFISFENKKDFEKNLAWKTRYNQIVLPIKNFQGEIRSLQVINEDGSFKGFLPNGEIKGNFTSLGPEVPCKSDKVIIAEGFATAASIHESTGLPVVIAFQSNNLLPVAKVFRENNPNQDIFIAADNDVKSLQGSLGKNSGMEAALITVDEIGGKLLYPPIFDSRSKEVAMSGWDWNDYAVTFGKQQTRREILQQIQGISQQTFQPDGEYQTFTFVKNDIQNTYLVQEKDGRFIVALQVDDNQYLKVENTFSDREKFTKFIKRKETSHFKTQKGSCVFSPRETKVEKPKGINKHEEIPTNFRSEILTNQSTNTDSRFNPKQLEPPVQAFYHTVLQQTKARDFTNEQKTVLRERLEIKATAINKKIKQKSKNHEQDR